MKTLLITAVLSTAFATNAAFAQAPSPAPSVPASGMTAATEAKFKAADKDGNGSLTGAELAPFKVDLAKIDTDKDGSISRVEFAAAAKAGVIK